MMLYLHIAGDYWSQNKKRVRKMTVKLRLSNPIFDGEQKKHRIAVKIRTLSKTNYLLIISHSEELFFWCVSKMLSTDKP